MRLCRSCGFMSFTERTAENVVYFCFTLVCHALSATSRSVWTESLRHRFFADDIKMRSLSRGSGNMLSQCSWTIWMSLDNRGQRARLSIGRLQMMINLASV